MAAQQPTYQAYTVVKREGQDDYWLNIGAAFMHQDGDGFNIMLQALPINGKNPAIIHVGDSYADLGGERHRPGTGGRAEPRLPDLFGASGIRIFQAVSCRRRHRSRSPEAKHFPEPN